ncbi:MAG: transposase [Bdellovibrionota bacterium]|nr:transposase [Pseudomonadota bacterium]MDY6090637.1 transposase [Bdellovibrionota bacterium]
MVKKETKHPEWATKFREYGKELRCINGKYYLYSYSNKYDPDRGRSVKVTGKLLGRITKEEGFIPSEKRRLKEIKDLKCKEYGLSKFILKQSKVVENLKKNFPREWKYLLMMAYSRLIHNSPIKRMSEDVEHSYLSEELGCSLNKKMIPDVLKEAGNKESERSSYMKSFITGGDFLLIDSTFIRCSISESALAKEGYNKEDVWESQVSLMYIYSKKREEPVYYRILPGNIRDVKSLSLTIRDSGVEKVMVIADKGFYSEDNVKELINQGLNFIIPLRRNSGLIKYEGLSQSKDVFVYQKRGLRYKKYLQNNGYVYLFLDVKMAGEEESNLILQTESHPEDVTIENVDEKKERHGTIAFFSNADVEAEEVYTYYKMRLAVEQSFDTLKTVLKADAPYMSDDDKLQGWMFVNHIAIQWCHEILRVLKQEKLISKISLEDAIRRLAQIKKIKISDTWYEMEQTKEENKIATLLLS